MIVQATEREAPVSMTGYPSIDKPWLRFYSREAIESELTNKCMYQYLFDANREHTADTAISYFGRNISYEELFQEIERSAKSLAEIGIVKGDVVSFCTVTVPEVIYAFYGLNMIGAIANMIDPRTSVEGIEDYLKESNSKCLIVLDALIPKLKKLLESALIHRVIVISPADSMPAMKRFFYRLVKHSHISSSKGISWLEMVHGPKKEFEPREYEKKLPVCIMHTGGTTGKPKGVLFSDDSYNHLNDQFNYYNMQPHRGDVFLNIMPPFIAYGMAVGIHEMLCCGSKIILIPLFDPDRFDKLIAKYRPQHFWGVPTHLDRLRTSSKLRKVGLSFLITAGVGGDACKIETEVKVGNFLRERGCRYGVTKGYGMTEVNSAACVCGDGYNKMGSVGIPLIHTTIAAFEPGTQRELPYGEQGEICMQAPSHMLGYLNNPEETGKVMQTHADGKIWIHSGDIGYVTEEGFVYIVDRMKRMIIREDGFKVYPSVIENVICGCEGVLDCAVVGVQSEHHSQGVNPKAYIVIDQNLASNAIMKKIEVTCRKTLAEYQIPAEVEILDALPVTKVGKIDYKALERYSRERNSRID